MKLQQRMLWGVAAAGLALAYSYDAGAQGEPRPLSREEIAAMVRDTMPPILKSDLPGLVDNLLSVPLGKPLSETFDPSRAAGRVFGRLPRTFAADCLRKTTPVGDPDQGDCTLSNGEEGGTGAYTRLSYSKNMGSGNIKFLKRGAVQDLDPGKLASVKLGDADADKGAREFLVSFFGLPAAELPDLPAGVRPPVRSLLIGFDKKAGLAPIVIQKTVHLQRSFKLAKPIQVPGTKQMLTHVPGPGMAMVALDDTGVIGAAVQDWQDVRRDPRMSGNSAKTSADLIQEIADDIYEEGGGPIASMKFRIVLGSDWRGSHGLLLPAVQVFVAPVANDPTEDQQQQMARSTTAGMVREYALVRRLEGDIQQRDPFAAN